MGHWENINRFLKFFDPDHKKKFKIYKPNLSENYSSFDAFNAVYKSRNMYVHDNKKGLSDNKLDYSGLKVFKPAIYQFMEDVIKILNLPVE